MPRPSAFRRLVSLLLAALVLAASVGLTVQRRACRLSGRSKVAVAIPGQRTPGGGNGPLAPRRPVVKDNCCDFSSHVHKLSAAAPELAAKTLVHSTLPAFWLLAVAWRRAAPAAVPAATRAPRWFAADSSPPPRGGRGLLAFVCKLMV